MTDNITLLKTEFCRLGYSIKDSEMIARKYNEIVMKLRNECSFSFLNENHKKH